MSNHHFPNSVERVVTDYLDRLSIHLKGMAAADRQEVLNEIRSHIYEAYSAETGDDEIGRILKVLRKLGEPAVVVADRISPAMARLGRKTKSPLYYLAAVLLALFGLPLGLGALAVLCGLLAALITLLIAYFAMAVSLVVTAVAGIIISLVGIFAPDFIFGLNESFGQTIISFGPFDQNPVLGGTLGLILCLLLAALGLLMLWAGRYIWRGFCYVVRLIAGKVKHVIGGRNTTGTALSR